MKMDRSKAFRSDISVLQINKGNERLPLNDLAVFLPQAALELQASFCISINRVLQAQYSGSPSKMKVKAKISSETSIKEANVATIDSLDEFSDLGDDYFIITLIYEAENVVQIRFDKNPTIPRLALKIIGLAINQQKFLTNLTVKKGLDGYVIYEISKFLPSSHITDICFDECVCKHANYDLLLKTSSNLKHLSLSRCNIDDDILMNIASTLCYPKPASRTLAVLNLSSNNITDIGAKYIAEALRSNRRLNYINLSSNRLTDVGAIAILDVLQQFHLTYQEVIDKKNNCFKYIKEKNELIESILKQYNSDDAKKPRAKRRASKTLSASAKKRGIEKEFSFNSIDPAKDKYGVDAATYDNAEKTTTGILGVFSDPYVSTNTVTIDDYLYSTGNNTLQYLNFAYNNMSFLTIRKLLSVLEYQKQRDIRPRGLTFVILEGNNMPNNCVELYKIEDLLVFNQYGAGRHLSLVKRKPGLIKSSKDK